MPQTSSMQPFLLLGLLLPALLAVGYPFRRRIYAVAGAALFAPAISGEAENEHTVHFTYRPAIDPFAAPAIGLAGPGAADTARVLALAALEECQDALLVIPRPDAIALFGLSEDELLDENTDGIFIPGNLDAALAYLETELAVRQGSGNTRARRLLIVADCEKESARIADLLNRPGEVSAVLLGEWPGDQVTVNENGLVAAPPNLTGSLPQRLPAMSRSEARDRLHAALAHQHRKPTRRSSHHR
ncbi:hypothetical protein [Spirillospora sp. NPDC047279]|uniref:hypothetical protein n=1 Tax=Spirillospora sp. NPDC047279 TaxID=3155478 RepID=UPI0034054514